MQKPSESNTRQKRLVPVIAIASAFLFFYAIHLLFPTVFASWNNVVNDGFFRLRYALFGKEKISPYIVHAVLNDSSFKKLDIPYGDRSMYARIITTLREASVSAIACDIFFEDATSRTNDKGLIDATKAKKNIYYPIFVSPGTPVPANSSKNTSGLSDEKSVDVTDTDRLTGKQEQLIEKNLWHPKIVNADGSPDAEQAIPPFYDIASNSAGLGHITCDPDQDGVNRRFPLVYRYGDGYIPALALRLVCDYLKVTPAGIEISFGNYISLKGARAAGYAKKDILIPIDNRGRIVINFAGPWADSFTHFPAHNLLKVEGDKGLRAQLSDDIAGSLVVFSNIATRNKDYGPGIFDSVYPLSGIHLNIVNSILTGNFIREAGRIEVIAGVLFLCFFLWLFAQKLDSLLFIMFSILFYMIFVIAGCVQFMFLKQLPSIVPPSLGYLFAAILILFYKLTIEVQEKKLLSERARTAATFEKANIELESANQKLRELDEYKNSFVQNMTHDFRTPLTLILSPLRSLIEDRGREIDSDSRNLLLLMQRSAKRLLILVNQLLELAKIRSNKMRLSVRYTDIASCLRSAIESFTPVAGSKNITLTFDTPEKKLFGYVDPEKVERIVYNLLSNAVKFTNKDGIITVSLKVTTDTDPEAKGDESAKKLVEIIVKDTGIGVPGNDMNKLFNRFEQIGNSVQNGIPGTGLGLSIVKAFAELHHGRVTVSSGHAQGTEFKVSLPLDKESYQKEEIDDKSGEAEAYNDINETRTNPAKLVSRVEWLRKTKDSEALDVPDRVLLVESDPEMRWYIKHVLEDFYNVVEAENDDDALGKINEAKPDLIIADFESPRLDGTQLLKELKNRKGSRDKPVLMISGEDGEGLFKDSDSDFPDEYLSKPFSSEELRLSVENLLMRGSNNRHNKKQKKYQRTASKNSELDKQSDAHNQSSLYPALPVLVVDDDKELLDHYGYFFSRNGISNFMLISDSRDVLPIIGREKISCMLLDLSMEHTSGEELLRYVSEKSPEIPVIVVTGHNAIDAAVRCIKTGAFDYFVKPVDFEQLVNSIRHCLEKRELERELANLKGIVHQKELKNPEAFSKIVTASSDMLAIFKEIETFAASPYPVLITGESGVGKELVARVIHDLSGRQGKFVGENIAGLDDAMFSDALYGHVKGAYTGAEQERRGLVEEASGGSLFLDEIGDLDIKSQVKLLRLLQEKEYRAQGSDSIKIANARIIVATNADLAQKQATGSFRTDLFYRLSRHHVHLPPLRERYRDLRPLVDYFFGKYAHDAGKTVPTVPSELFTLLKTYDFPGNVRELEAMVINALYNHKSKVLSLSYFREYIDDKKKNTTRGSVDKSHAVPDEIMYSGSFPVLEKVEDFFIREALKKAENNHRVAARLLGISPFALSRRLKKSKDNSGSR